MKTTIQRIEDKTNAGNTTYTVSVPAGCAWRRLLVECKLVTDVTVANRSLVVQLLDEPSGDLLFPTRVGPAQAASQTRHYVFGEGLTEDVAFVDTDKFRGMFPTNLVLPAGATVSVSVTNGVAGDNFEVRVIAEEESVA